jgi:plasmid maintenance system antidote protein VapI
LATKVTFEVLQQRLLSHLAERVSNGEFSERQLAAKLGISQPQIHRLLKGLRRLTPEVADIILAHLDFSVVDLLQDHEIASHSAAVNVPRKEPGRQEASGKFARGSTA